MDYYQELLKALGNADDVEYLFRTQRPDNQKYAGSFYAQHSGNATSGFREPSNEAGKGYKLQPKSYRTLYLDPRATDAVHSWFRDQNISTYAIPEADEKGRPTGHLLIKSAETELNKQHELFLVGRQSICICDIIDSVSKRGSLNLRINQKAEKTYLHIENSKVRKAFDWEPKHYLR